MRTGKIIQKQRKVEKESHFQAICNASYNFIFLYSPCKNQTKEIGKTEVSEKNRKKACGTGIFEIYQSGIHFPGPEGDGKDFPG